MRAFAPALLLALLITQVDSAVNPLEVLRRNGGSISWVVEIEVPDDGNVDENEAENVPIYVDAIIEADLDVDFENTTEQTRRSTSDDDSSSFLKNKILWHVEDIGEKAGNIESGNVQKSTGFPLEARIEITATQEAKHTEDVEQRIESTDVQTESRHSINIQGKEAVEQTETQHTPTQKVVPAIGDRRSNTFPESNHLDVVQERLDSDTLTERSQGGDTPRSEGALGQNGTEYTATQKQVLAAGDRTSGTLESKPSGAAQNRTEGPDVKIEKRLGGEARGNEDALAPNGSGTSQMESARGIHHVPEVSNGTESSGNSSRREAADSRKGNVSSQGSDRSTTTETARHVVLAERQMVLEERQMTGGGGEAPATKEANETLSVRAKDPQKEIELTNGSRSIAPEREKKTTIGSEATVRQTNQERNSVPKDALETTQVAARPTVTSLQKEEVQRQVATSTESAEESQASQAKRAATSRSAEDRTAAAETDGVKSAEDSTSGKGLKKGMAARSLEPQDAGETEVDSTEETPAKLTLTLMEEKREVVRSDAMPVGRRDYGRKRDGIRAHSSVPGKGEGDAGSASEKRLHTENT